MDIDNQIKNYFNNKKNKKDVKINNFQHEFSHTHESIKDLRLKFGEGYDTISVRRNKYERFISLWKHILHEMDLKEHPDVYKICKKLKLNDILFYSSQDLEDDIAIMNTVDEFTNRFKLKKISEYGKNMILILLKPYSYYHLHDPNIIWFDFDKLYELEEWVSKKLNMNFKLEKINSSKHYKSQLILDDKFIEKYDSIYKIYDENKNLKTLI